MPLKVTDLRDMNFDAYVCSTFGVAKLSDRSILTYSNRNACDVRVWRVAKSVRRGVPQARAHKTLNLHMGGIGMSENGIRSVLPVRLEQ